MNLRPALLSLMLAWAMAARAADLPDASHGQLLYDTHCISCHGTQVHWRGQRLAHDWPSLQAQVQRWQSNSALGWREADVQDVARYLSDTIYHFEPGASAQGPTPALSRLQALP